MRGLFVALKYVVISINTEHQALEPVRQTLSHPTRYFLPFGESYFVTQNIFYETKN
jgi:hypothetical protein